METDRQIRIDRCQNKEICGPKQQLSKLEVQLPPSLCDVIKRPKKTLLCLVVDPWPPAIPQGPSPAARTPADPAPPRSGPWGWRPHRCPWGPTLSPEGPAHCPLHTHALSHAHRLLKTTRKGDKKNWCLFKKKILLCYAMLWRKSWSSMHYWYVCVYLSGQDLCWTWQMEFITNFYAIVTDWKNKSNSFLKPSSWWKRKTQPNNYEEEGYLHYGSWWLKMNGVNSTHSALAD